MPHDINVFKNIFQFLKDWYIEETNISDENFSSSNDFSILKVLKLQFFISSINSKENSSLLDGYSFFAMPYGPVETETYRRIKANDIEGLIIDRYSTTIFDNFSLEHSEESREIINAGNILKSIEPNLITADAIDLVELSHKWNSWRRNYSLARTKGVYSILIPDEEIINDNKIVDLSLV